MKALFLFMVLLLTTAISFSQSIIINQSIVQQPPYHVGDTLTFNYTVTNTSTSPRYFWLRYQWNNSALQLVPNSTVFSQGNASQTYFTMWNNYQFSSYPTIGIGDLYGQYQHTPWNYISNNSWNVGQLTVQRTDAAVSGVIASQKFILLDKNDYTYVHKLDLANAIDVNGNTISNIGSQILDYTIPASSVLGNTSAYKIMIAYPAGDTSIVNLNAQLMALKTDGTTDWSKPPIAQTKFNAQGIATFATLKVGQQFAAYVTPSFNKSYLDNIVTVSDAYKAFLGVSEVGLTGNSTYFTYPTLQKIIGNVSTNPSIDSTFDNNDAYYLFSYVMGIDVSSKARIPSSTATTMNFISGKYQNWAAGLTSDHTFTINSINQTDTLAYAYGGDLNFSNSTDPSLIPGAQTGLSIGNSSGIGKLSVFGTTTTTTITNATLSLASTISNGKVILTGTLTQADLAGLQVILQYDNTKLTLDNVTFDAGNTITNFSTNNGNRLTFGSIDQLKTARIKTGTPYTLTFTSNVPLTSTAGLFFTVLADAVDGNGNKVTLTVE
jgi:hypothetical protein